MNCMMIAKKREIEKGKQRERGRGIERERGRREIEKERERERERKSHGKVDNETSLHNLVQLLPSLRLSLIPCSSHC